MKSLFDILSYLSKSSVSALQPETGQPAKDLLSADTPDTFESTIQNGIEEMDAYSNSHPSDGTLPPEERARYENNREFVKKTAKLNILRNLILLEIWERGQWRFEFQDIKDFAHQVADLSRAQLYKCIDDAKILRSFARKGTISTAPRGRMVEEICKVPEEHRIEAWQYAHEVTKEKGVSRDSARIALRDYCRDNKLRYGRKGTNPPASKEDDSNPVSAPMTDIACEPPQVMNRGETVGELPPLGDREEKIVVRAVTPAILRKVEKCFPTKSPHEVILYNIRSNYPEARLSSEDQNHVGELLRLLASRHPEVLDEMMMHALKHVKATIETIVLKYCKKNTFSKMAYQKKKKTAVKHTTDIKHTTVSSQIAVRICCEPHTVACMESPKN